MKTLNDLTNGQIAKVGSLLPTLSAGRRLTELGLLPGVEIRFVKSAPLGDPIAVEIDGRQLSMRREDAAQILVEAV